MEEILLVINYNDVWNKFWHFFIVGGGGFAIDAFLTFFLFKRVKLPKYVANSIGFLTGVTFNYIFNRIWTFQSHDPQIMVEYTKFATIGIIGLIIVNGITYLLHAKNKVEFFKAKVLAMIVFMFWNFGANYFYTFG